MSRSSLSCKSALGAMTMLLRYLLVCVLLSSAVAWLTNPTIITTSSSLKSKRQTVTFTRHSSTSCRRSSKSIEQELGSSVIDHQLSRRNFLKNGSVSAAIALGIGITAATATQASEIDPVLLERVKQGKAALQPCRQLIKDAKWDSVRTVLKREPLANMKSIVGQIAEKSDDGDLILGLRQDILDHLQFLDTFVYNNVFIGEDRQILGTKIDYATPLDELRQAEEAFDALLEML